MRTLRPCGLGAVIVECDGTADALGLWRRLDRAPLPGMTEAVPAATTVLVVGELDDASRAALRSLPCLAGEREGAGAPPVEIGVRYRGPDLEGVARATGLEASEVVRRHHSADYTVAFGGFAPGFAYLTGLPAELQIPRLGTPRSRVPPGSVAIADQYTAVYPRASPGGWRLVGVTDITLFDPAADPPSLLRPGTRVRFTPLP